MSHGHIEPARTAYRSPWQNGVAERWVGSVRRELLNHVVVFNERHLRRLLREYVAYYHDDRAHLGLGKATPAGRPVSRRRDRGVDVVALPRVGGLPHRYDPGPLGLVMVTHRHLDPVVANELGMSTDLH